MQHVSYFQDANGDSWEASEVFYYGAGRRNVQADIACVMFRGGARVLFAFATRGELAGMSNQQLASFLAEVQEYEAENGS